MTVDDGAPVPTDDSLARSTRRALGAIAGRPEPSWDAVVVGVRRLRRVRFAIGAAIVATLVIAVATAVSAAGGHARSVQIESPAATSTTTSTLEHTSTKRPAATTTTTPTRVEVPARRTSRGGALPDATPKATGAVAVPTSTTTTTSLAPLHPSAMTLAVTLDSVDDTTMTVGQTTTLHGTVTNITTQPVTTQDYFATIASCGPPGAVLQNQGYLPRQELQPQQTISYAVAFTAAPKDVGTVYCTVGFSTQLPEISAPAGPGPNVLAIVVNATTPTT